MPFAAVLPFIVIAVVLAIVRSSVEQNKRRAAQSRQAQTREKQAAFEGQTQYSPVKPSVQAPPVRKETKVWTEGTAPKGPLMHQGHDHCAVKQEDPKAKNKHPEHDLCALDPNTVKAQNDARAQTDASKPNGPLLTFTPDQILNGVILSEILGKPKALR